MADKDFIDITPSPRVLSMLGEIDMPVHSCIAELIDNSIDAFMAAEKNGNPVKYPEIQIKLPSDNGNLLVISDNGPGMSLEQLENSLRAGYSSKARYGNLGLFGMGFNVATARLGIKTEVATTVSGSTEQHRAIVDQAMLQANESFNVPLQSTLVTASETGTWIGITVKPQMIESLRKSLALRRQLGDIYSYILRREIPGIRSEFAGAPKNIKILVDNKLVEPTTPCVWSDKRSVQSGGQTVPAVHYVDQTLPEQRYCPSCGEWTTDEAGPCGECGGRELVLQRRRVWGWIGLQRYLHTDRYGIDFIRNGRKILRKDKSVFQWLDPETGDSVMEYPVEMPANKGRIVGEIHLDHVPVNYLKDRFVEESPAWSGAMRIIRGSTALQPRRRPKGTRNDSPISQLFNAFRRNDAGTKYLIGSGGNSVHQEWAEDLFLKDPDYYEDTKWWEAAVQADGVVVGEVADSPIDHAFPLSANRIATPVVAPHAIADVAKTESLKEKFERVIPRSEPLYEVSRTYKLDTFGTWKIEAFLAPVQDSGPSGSPVEVLSKGRDHLQVIAYRASAILTDYARDPNDLVLVAVASAITQSAGSGTVGDVYQRLLEFLPDQKLTDAAVQSSAEALLRAMTERIDLIIRRDPEIFWAALSAKAKQEIQSSMFHVDPNIQLATIPLSANYASHMSFGHFVDLLNAIPEELFDGNLIRGVYESLNENERELQRSRFVNWVQAIENMTQHKVRRSTVELRILRLQIERLHGAIADGALS